MPLYQRCRIYSSGTNGFAGGLNVLAVVQGVDVETAKLGNG
jgi:hypothetical protein